MNEALMIGALEQLKPFMNKDGVIEIVMRGRKSRIRAIHKIILNNLPQAEAQQAVAKAIQVNAATTEKNLNRLLRVAKLQNVGLILNGMNLCATCAGFAVVCSKLNEMGTKIEGVSQQIEELHRVIIQGMDESTTRAFNEVLAEYSDMLDARKVQKPYAEEALRKLIDAEYTVLNRVLRAIQDERTGNVDSLIVSAFALLSMLTVTLRDFDEQYYFHHHEVVGEREVWHTSHEKWVKAYEMMQAPWLIEKLQDHGTFDLNLSSSENDLYVHELQNQVKTLYQEVLDNQRLILELGEAERIRALREMNAYEVKEHIEAILKEILERDSENAEIYKETLNKAVLV